MTATSVHSVSFGREEVHYRLRYADRETLEIAVHPSGEVTVAAPRGASLEEIEEKIRNRLRWITRRQREFRRFEPRTPSRRFLSGETHLYLGRQYRLKVEQHIQASVRLWAGRIWVYSHRPSCVDVTRELLDEWYLSRAREKFPERLEQCWNASRLMLAKPTVEIRRMSRRWGTLTSAGRMILNRDLIRAPAPCIDYVITHELCHLQHPDHSRAFYDLLERLMPDWEIRKHRLEQVMV